MKQQKKGGGGDFPKSTSQMWNLAQGEYAMKVYKYFF